MECGVHQGGHMKQAILTLVLFPFIASAQRFTFGIQGGVPAQTPAGRTDSMPFALGPSVNARVFSGLSLETGVLYHRFGRGFDSFAFFYPENAVTLGFETWRGSALEVPFLAKYRFLGERREWRPFLAAGPTVRRTSFTTDWASSVISGSPLGSSGGSVLNRKTTQWNVDPTVGMGVDLRKGRFHIEPEVRYSYWGAGTSGRVRKNQVNFLVGFRF